MGMSWWPLDDATQTREGEQYSCLILLPPLNITFQRTLQMLTIKAKKNPAHYIPGLGVFPQSKFYS